MYGGNLNVHARICTTRVDEPLAFILPSQVLSGMAGAMGSIFTTPVLAVMILAELNVRNDDDNALGRFRGSFMRRMTLYTAAASSSFSVYYALLDSVYMDHLTANLPASFLSETAYTLKWWHCALGGLLGILGAAVGILCLIIVGVCKRMFDRLRDRLQPCHALVRRVVPTLVGGALFGLLAVACPLTLGSGESQMAAVIEGSLWQSGALGSRHVNGARNVFPTPLQLLNLCVFPHASFVLVCVSQD